MTRSIAVGAAELTGAAAHLIGAGKGCDGRLSFEPENEAFVQNMRVSRDPSKTRRALRLWGLSDLAARIK